MKLLPKHERRAMEAQAAKLGAQAGELEEELRASRWENLTPIEKFTRKVQEAVDGE